MVGRGFWPGLWEPWFWSGLNPNHRGTLGPTGLSGPQFAVTNKKIEFIGEAKCLGFDIEKERAFKTYVLSEYFGKFRSNAVPVCHNKLGKEE